MRYYDCFRTRFASNEREAKILKPANRLVTNCVGRSVISTAIVSAAVLFAVGARSAEPVKTAVHVRSQATVADTRSFAIADQQLSTFLAWVARRTRRKLVYDGPEAEAVAHRVRLRGTIAGLSPEVALEAVLSTTSLRLSQSDAESIHVGIVSPID